MASACHVLHSRNTVQRVLVSHFLQRVGGGGDLVSCILGSHSSSLQRRLAARREDITTSSDGEVSAIPDDPPDINSLFDWIIL